MLDRIWQILCGCVFGLPAGFVFWGFCPSCGSQEKPSYGLQAGALL